MALSRGQAANIDKSPFLRQPERFGPNSSSQSSEAIEGAVDGQVDSSPERPRRGEKVSVP